MINSSKYILDTNILFGFDTWGHESFSPDFWVKLESDVTSGKVILLDVVVKEIMHKKELIAWCKKLQSAGLVTKITNDDRIRGVQINDTYQMIKQGGTKSEVDTYILAYAERNKVGICSREKRRTKPGSLYKIPDVCDLLKIPCISNPETLFKHIV